jgi:intracellular septation protein
MSGQKDAPKGLSFILDFGPLLTFFLVNHFAKSPTDPAQGPIWGTAAFMIAIILAMIVSRWKLGKISIMMWVSAVLVVGLGGITVFLGDPVYIQIKPTIVYLLFAAILFGGLLRGKALLKYILEYAFEGVEDAGWRKLSRNWALFFLVMAGINEIIRRPELFSFDSWLAIKVWGVSALSFIFTLSQIPMLIKHGLKLAEDVHSQSDANKP